MKSTLIPFCLAVLTLISCAKNEEKRAKDTVATNVITQTNNQNSGKNLEQQTRTDTTVIINDQFVYDVSEKYLTYDFYLKNYSVHAKQSVLNKHDRTITDTLVKFKKDSNSGEFYVAKENVILQYAQITNGPILKNTNFRIGASAAEIGKYFKIDQINRVLKIEDFEKTTAIYLDFKNNSLARFTYCALYLD